MFAITNLWPGREGNGISLLSPAARMRGGLAAAMRVYLAAYHRLDIVGADQLPRMGPFVMISNHASHLDAVSLRAALPRQRLASAFTVVAEDYFSANPLRSISARLLANAVPLSRRLHIRDGLRQCRSVLGDDQGVLIFFPEGTRSRDGTLGAFRPGIGALLAGSKWPVVPCAIRGSFEAWPKGNRIARPEPIKVIVGQPRRYDQLPRTRHAQHAVAEELRAAVEGLLCN